MRLGILTAVIIIILAYFGYKISSVCEITYTIEKVTKLEVQQMIKSSDEGKVKTNMRYLIITNKATYISESSLLNGKFDNSDVFYHLEEGKTYRFKLSGYGKGLLTDYKNVIEAVEIIPKPLKL